MTYAGVIIADGTVTWVERDGSVRRESREGLIAKAEAAMASWCQRHREAMAAMSALMHAVRLSRDPVRTAEVWMDWYNGALQRLIDDTRDQTEVALALARCCGDGRLLEPDHPSAEDLSHERGPDEEDHPHSGLRPVRGADLSPAQRRPDGAT